MDSPVEEQARTKVEEVLAGLDRDIAWLARRAGFKYHYAWKMLRGLRPATGDFKAAVADVLERPVEELFPEQAA